MAIVLLLYILAGALLYGLLVLAALFARNVFDLLSGDDFSGERLFQAVSPVFDKAMEGLSSFFSRLPEQWREQAVRFQDSFWDMARTGVAEFIKSAFKWVPDFTTSIPGFFVGLIFTVMLSFFISMQYEQVTGFFRAQLPAKAKLIIQDLRSIVVDSVFRYVKALFKLMIITFLELSAGLLVLRTPGALPIAAGIAVFDALPIFGTGAIMIPWVLFELLLGNFPYAVGLGILYAIVTVVRSFIEPKIVGDKLGLNPIVSMVSIYIGFKIWGVLGMIFMPIVVQILLELHKKGRIALFHQAEEQKPGEK